MKENCGNGFHFHGRRLAALLILASSVIPPVYLALQPTASPQTRDIHVEAFRYGFNPSRIEANRGDRLRLTFSTRDTGQSFFLQDYDLHVIITPGSKVVEVYGLSRPDVPPARVAVVEITAGPPGWWGRFVSKSQFRNHTYNGPMHGTERGDLIVAPNYLLAGGLALLCAIPLAALLLVARPAGEEYGRGTVNLFDLFPWLKRLMKRSSFQSVLTLPMLAVFYFLILAGLLGTKVSGRNAEPMVIWVLWLSALILVLVPLGGRIWCLACPLPSLGEWMQRHRAGRSAPGAETGSAPRFSRLPLTWPDWLRGAWPRLLFFLALGTFSTPLVALPPATSWLLIGLACLAMATSIFPEQRLFCRYLCPINGFISMYSMTGRLIARAVSTSTCARCNEHFCLTGSAKGWGCPYGLCMGEVSRNNDCGMCGECVKTCAYDNVAFFWRRTGWDRNITSYGEAWQAIVLFALSVIYGIINLSPWHQVRDWVDIVDKQNWLMFCIYGVVVWVVCLVVLPLILFLLIKIGLGISNSSFPAGLMFRSCSAAFVPLGLSGWMAFALAMLLSMMTFVLQSLSDPLNWGWDLLGTAGSRWHILWAPAIPWLQVVCILIGFAYSLRTLHLCWRDTLTDRQRAILGSFPPALLLWTAAAGLLYFYAG